MREPANTNPGIERLFLEVIDAAGLVRPATNVFVEGCNVDALWREQKLIVELDSRAPHMHARGIRGGSRATLRGWSRTCADF